MNKKITIPIVALAGIALGWLLYWSGTPTNSPNQHSVLVTSIVDGDTFRIEGGEKVRILGIDTPERDECYFGEAREFLHKLIDNKYVRLDKDIEDRDKYGRLLRYVFIEKENQDNELVNETLVREGYAFDYYISPNKRYKDLFVSAREEAKRENRGLWAECNYREEDTNPRSRDDKPDNDECVIKANVSEKGYGKTYLLPGCDNYDRVKIDISKGENYFCSEIEAQALGFTKATNCPAE
jgi:micrococcal nuclease